MEEYIKKSPRIIRLSSSSAGTSFCFVAKKDNGGLNDITVKIQYPLPLVLSTFELLQGDTIYSQTGTSSSNYSGRLPHGPYQCEEALCVDAGGCYLPRL